MQIPHRTCQCSTALVSCTRYEQYAQHVWSAATYLLWCFLLKQLLHSWQLLGCTKVPSTAQHTHTYTKGTR
jgi:hypothetical protein